MRDRCTVICVTWCEGEVEQLSFVVDHQMQLEAKEPIHRSFTACRQVFKHFVLRDATVVTNFETGGIKKTDACTVAEARTEIGTQGQQGAGYSLNKTPVANQAWKGRAPVSVYLLGVVSFEIAIGRLVEADENRHNFAQTQTAPSTTMSESIA